MPKKHQRTLAAIFASPTRSDIRWDDIVALFVYYGAEVTEGRGSRVRVALNGVRAVFHSPHPGNQVNKGMVESVRRFLLEAGISDSKRSK